MENEFSSVSNTHSGSDPLDEIDLNSPIVFTILHKPRGSKGVWSQLSMNQRVRVTYGRGKNLQLLIRSTHEHYLHDHALTLYLEQKVEDNWHDLSSDGFSIEKKHPVTNDVSEQFPNHPYLVRYDVKIFVIHKLISFRIEYNGSPDQPPLSIRSVEIFTHNSGRRECLKHHERRRFKTISTFNQSEGSHNLQTTPITNNQWEVVDTNLNVNGIVRAQTFQQYSDLRLKSNIEDLVDALNIVTSLKGKTYQWKKGSDPSANETSGNRVIGLIAQEVMQVLPEVVDEVDGYLSIRYTEIIPVLIEAFKQQAFQFEEFKKNINEEVSVIKEKLDSISHNKDLKTSQSEDSIDHLKLQQEAAMLYLQAWMKSVNQSNKQSDNHTCGNCKVNMPDTKSKKEKKSFFDKMKSFSDIKWKIFAIVLLSLLIIAGITVGMYYIILKNIHSTPNLSSNLLLNPSFEDIDNHGKASGWMGNYWLLTTNEEIAKLYNEDQNIYWIPDNEDHDEWPFSIYPVHGSLLLHTFVNSTHHDSFYAYASVPFVELNTEKIKYLNVSTWASCYFNLNSSMLSSAFQLNIIVNYQGDESEAYGLDFDYDDKRKWNYREIIIKVDETKVLEYVEVIIVSTFEGYSFWDSVNLQYITSPLPSVVRLGKKRELKECNGLKYCT